MHDDEPRERERQRIFTQFSCDWYKLQHSRHGRPKIATVAAGKGQILHVLYRHTHVPTTPTGTVDPGFTLTLISYMYLTFLPALCFHHHALTKKIKSLFLMGGQ